MDVTPAPGTGGRSSPVLDEAPSLSSHLRLVILRMSRRLRQEKVGDVTASQMSALSSINLAGAASLGELAATERIAPPSMTRIVARLEEQGFVRRRHDSTDRRVSRLEITPSGEALIAEIRSRRDAFLAERLQGLSDEEREIVNRALPIFERIIADGS
ncbi:MAG: MarR family transcriptional regulator [Actinomycetota bacterium]|nr:MarR family transcriptional regulator [Actinomycetota bacterium]